MTQFDPSSLPQPLPAYFAADDHGKTAGMFAADALVHDEGVTHQGTAAIGDWLVDVEARYHPRYTVKAATTAAEQTIVTFEVAGTFPGSPAVLGQAFVVADGRIVSLRTL